MSALAKGYPGARRTPRGMTDRQVMRRGVAQRRGTYLLEELGSSVSSAKETFLRDDAVRTFGKKLPKATYRRALLSTAGKGLARALPGVGTAVLAYELFQLVTPGAPIPRAWSNPSDRALTFPSNWTVVNVAPNPPVFAAPYADPEPRYWQEVVIDPPVQTVEPGDGFDWASQESSASEGWLLEVDPSTLVNANGTFPRNRTVSEDFHYDASADYAGNVHGTRSSWQAYKHATGADPTFTNAPRISPETVTVVALPVQPAAPGRPTPRWKRARDPAENPQTDRGEPSPEKSAPPVPLVPPTFVITAGRPSPRANSRPRGRSRIKPRIDREGNPRARGPRARPHTRPSPNRARARPRKGEDEKKGKIVGKLGQAFALIGNVMGGFAEYMDAINAIYNALPKQYRPGYVELHYRDKTTGEIKTFWKRRWKPSWQERHEAVMKHHDKISTEDIIRKLLENDAEDRAYGKLGKMSAKSARHSGNRGWQLGSWDTFSQKELWDLKERGRIKRERAERDADLHAKAVKAEQKRLRTATFG